jgi:hypothetical protein
MEVIKAMRKKKKEKWTITQETWNQLTFWQQKRIYYLVRWYVFKGHVEKWFAGLKRQAGS